MDIRKLQRAIVDGLEDVKGQNIVVFNTEHLSSLFERVIIASGTSNRQTKSLASSVREAVKSAGFPVPRLEGEANGEWIIVDCGAAVAHVMQPAIREYYHLEEIWGDKPVKMKLDGAGPARAGSEAVRPDASIPQRRVPPAAGSKGLRRGASIPQPERDADGKGSASKKASAKRAPATKAPAKKAPMKKAPAKKVVAKTGVTRVVGVKKAAAKTTAKTVAKKAPPRKTVAAKKAPAARKTAAHR